MSDDHRGGKSIGVDQRYGPGCACLCKGKAAHPEVRLLVVGDGSLRRQMEQQVQAAGIIDSVEFVGSQPQKVLAQYYDRIDIY